LRKLGIDLRLSRRSHAGIALLLLMAALSVGAHAQEKLPADVARYVERRDLCDHFRGEEPYDAQRRKFLEQRTRRYCTGTDAKLAALKRKYRARSEVISRLDEYEARIETP
jgi:hypothetical protein